MNADFDALARLNDQINAAEDGGETAELDKILASAFAFRRASGVVVDRAAFLGAVAKSGPRTQTIRSISLSGHDRALVTCWSRCP